VKPSRFQIRFWLMLLLAIFTTGCIHTTAPVFSKGEFSETTDKTSDAADMGIKDPAVIVHIDPKTGRIVAPSPAALSGEVAQPSVGTAQKSPAELRETLSPVPGGGVVIELDERFMTPLTATIDSEGKLHVEHQPTMSSSDENK